MASKTQFKIPPSTFEKFQQAAQAIEFKIPPSTFEKFQQAAQAIEVNIPPDTLEKIQLAVQAGQFELRADTLQTIQGIIQVKLPEETIRMIQDAQFRLATVIQEAPEEPSTPTVAAAVQAELSPLVAALKRYAPTDSAALAAWIAVFLMIVQILHACQQEDQQTIVKNTNQVTIQAPHEHDGSPDQHGRGPQH